MKDLQKGCLQNQSSWRIHHERYGASRRNMFDNVNLVQLTIKLPAFFLLRLPNHVNGMV